MASFSNLTESIRNTSAAADPRDADRTRQHPSGNPRTAPKYAGTPTPDRKCRSQNSRAKTKELNQRQRITSSRPLPWSFSPSCQPQPSALALLAVQQGWHQQPSDLLPSTEQFAHRETERCGIGKGPAEISGSYQWTRRQTPAEIEYKLPGNQRAPSVSERVDDLNCRIQAF